jgi:hypothetical protein
VPSNENESSRVSVRRVLATLALTNSIYTNCTHSTSSKQNLKILSAPCCSASSGFAAHHTTSKKGG